MINKSKATLSKYENGAITIDIETLYEIAQALDIELKCFIDYQPPMFRSEPALPKNNYFNQSLAYMYYYDGRVRQMTRSLLRFSHASDHDGIEVTLYMGVVSFSDPDRCQHLFTGEMKAYDTITHMVLTNQINEAEKLYICMLNPMQNRMPAVGLVSGIGSSPFFAPIALKRAYLQRAAGGGRPPVEHRKAGQGRLSSAALLQHDGGQPSRPAVSAIMSRNKQL